MIFLQGEMMKYRQAGRCKRPKHFYNALSGGHSGQETAGRADKRKRISSVNVHRWCQLRGDDSSREIRYNTTTLRNCAAIQSKAGARTKASYTSMLLPLYCLGLICRLDATRHGNPPPTHLITFLCCPCGRISSIPFECIFNIMKTFIMQALCVIKQGPSSRDCLGCSGAGGL